MTNPVIFDKCYGCVLGAFIGDALGVPLEFTDHVTPQLVDQAMTLCGGGVHGAGSGQISDDSELMLAQSYGLLDRKAQTDSEREDSVAAMYCRWIRSSPFDRGLTCTRAFSFSPNHPNISTAMREHVASCNIVSKANGALMRIAPLIVYGHKLPTKKLVDLVRRDAELSHPNQTCSDVNAVFAVTVAHLINNPGDSTGALHAADNYAAEGVCEEVKVWLKESKSDCSKLDCSSQLIGFVKWAFILAFWHLQQKSDYITAMRHVLGRGGDSDTNCAIVGCMIGGFVGAKGIPEYMKSKVLSYKNSADANHKRPDWLLASNLVFLAKELYTAAC